MPRQTIVAILATLLILGLAAWAYSIYEKNGEDGNLPMVSSFGECVAAGYPVMESYPRQCRANGVTYVEDIGNQQDENDVIRVMTPRANTSVASPLHIEGEARGNWFFEAQFPVNLLDDQGRLLATGIARTRDNWQTEDFVPFELDLEFTMPTAERGTLVFKRANPSGLPENDAELVVPVFFDEHNGKEDPSVSSMRLEVSQLTVPEQDPLDVVYVSSAVVPAGGYVVIHASVDGKPGEVIGSSQYITKTGAAAFTIDLKRDLRPGENIFALLHVDDGDGKYLPSRDVAIIDGEEPIAVSVTVRDMPATTVIATTE